LFRPMSFVKIDAIWKPSVCCSALSTLCLFWSAFSNSPKAHMLLRSRRANTFMEEIKEELCNFEEAREIFNTREATLEFWMAYKDGNQCDSNPCVHGKCVDLLQDYSCTCNAGFEGKRCGLLEPLVFVLYTFYMFKSLCPNLFKRFKTIQGIFGAKK
uniref:Vitamin K-dependent protein C-like n=1 Tax=Sinocyclocheilus anshuiensis TaxID=1608454 RepID=A0A671PZ19_9TELE